MTSTVHRPPLTIVYVGQLQGTCLHRAWALTRLGHRVHPIENPLAYSGARGLVARILWRYRIVPDLASVNRKLLAQCRRVKPDVVWIDKGLNVHPTTLRTIRSLHPTGHIVSYSPDDMFNPRVSSRLYMRAIRDYTVHVTTKSFNVPELRAAGARDVIFIGNAFEPTLHRPLSLSSEDRALYGAAVGFVGMYERERAEWMLRLATDGIRVSIWGHYWHKMSGRHPNLNVHRRFLHELEYVKAIVATDINLGFLRKENRDLQTTRSVEVPATRSFLLAERTSEHAELFVEGAEAEFFGSYDELLSKIRRYLANPEQRRAIERAGYRRCIESGYSNDDRIRTVLARLGYPHDPGP